MKSTRRSLVSVAIAWLVSPGACTALAFNIRCSQFQSIGGAIERPEPPTCIDKLSVPFTLDELESEEFESESASCRSELESYRSTLNDYLSCLNSEAEGASSSFSDAVNNFNQKVRSYNYRPR